ncbi:MAG: adenylate/guanylate cyclase domain-containing protein [Candidatus Micrarchaeia archaeon]
MLENVVLLLLLYISIKMICRYLDTNDVKYIAMTAMVLLVFFNIWFNMYSEIFREFIEQFRIITSVMPIAIIIVIMYVEGRRVKEEKEKIKTKQFFSKYVSENIVEKLLEQKDLQLGGEKHQVTVVFTDVRGFTSLSEKLDPKQIVELLNGHFDIITEEIFNEDGTVLKYIGDATMAVFNAPVQKENHAVCAIKACVKIQNRMREYARMVKKKYGVNNFSIGIGVNTGEVVMGNIGSYRYMDYTVIGDTVNIASRLNGVAKSGEIVVSESTYELVKGKFRFSEPEEVAVKGKSIPIKVYRVEC